MHVFISGLSILLHWPLCLFLCQSRAVCTHVALQHSLKSGSVAPPALFLLSLALATWGLLWFRTDFKIVCSLSLKNAIGVLMWIVLNV